MQESPVSPISDVWIRNDCTKKVNKLWKPISTTEKTKQKKLGIAKSAVFLWNWTTFASFYLTIMTLYLTIVSCKFTIAS